MIYYIEGFKWCLYQRLLKLDQCQCLRETLEVSDCTAGGFKSDVSVPFLK